MNFKKALLVTLLIFPGIFIVLLLAVVLSGAQFLDGLFGVYNNNAFQELLVRIYILSVFVTPIGAIIVSTIWFAAHRKEHKRAWIVPVLPLAIIGCAFLTGAILGSDAWRTINRQNMEKNDRELGCNRLDVASADSRLSQELASEVWVKSFECSNGSMTRAEVDELMQRVEDEFKADANSTR